MRPILPAVALASLLIVASCAPAPAPVAPGPETPRRALFPDADTVRVTNLAPGAHHLYAWLPEGPWAVHVVEVDEAVCRPEVFALKAGPPLEERALSSVLGADALAAINADFFMLPGGTPVGAHVRGGRVLVGPGSRPVYSLDEAGGHRAGPETLAGFAAAPGDTAALVQVNRPVAGGRHHPPRPGLTLFDAWAGDRAPADSAGRTLRLRLLPPPAPSAPAGAAADGWGDAWRGRGVVVSVHPAGERVELDGDHVALQAVGEASGWLDRRSRGDTLTWRAALVPAHGGRPALEAVGGFPALVTDGQGVVAAQDGVIESFGSARHPRTAVGWDEADRRLFWVVVDGRQGAYSDGMTLAELESLFLRLGATEAINLDGGGSTTLVLRGQVANRPSDREGERPVSNALVLRGCRTAEGRGAQRPRGSSTMNSAPPVGRVAARAVPPWSSEMARTMERPRPVPEVSSWGVRAVSER